MLCGWASLLFIEDIRRWYKRCNSDWFGCSTRRCFGVIAAFGISTISYLFHSYSDIIQFIGGAFLLYISYNDIK